jgi:hypothetical protein
MIVNWQGTGVLTIPATDPGIKTVEKTEGGSEMPRKIGAEEVVMLIPGYNEVTDELWAKAARNCLHHIKSGKIEEMGKEDTDEDGNKFMRSYPIRKIVPSKAMEVVKGCFNLKSLEFWLTGSEEYDAETRDEIRAMIKDQIEKIKNGNRDTVASTR